MRLFNSVFILALTFSALSPGVMAQDSTYSVKVWLNTTPPNVSVTYADSLFGTTPLFTPISSLYLPLVLKKKGYEDLIIRQPVEPGTLVALTPYSDLSASVRQEQIFPWLTSKNNVKFWSTIGALLATGGTAVYFKQKASAAYAKYEDNPLNTRYLDETNRNDTISAVFLITTEIAFGYLLYQLFWEESP